MNRLSYSAISTYLQCPLQYKLIYIDRLKRLPKSYFSFGRSLHNTTAYFYSATFTEPPHLSKLLEYYGRNWVSEGYKSKEEEKENFELGKVILGVFHKVNSEDYKKPLVVEYSFNVNLDGIILTGIIDRVDKLPSENLEIIDYKSGKSFPSENELSKDLQLSLYHIAAEKTWKTIPKKLTFYHLRSNTPISTKRNPEQIKNAVDLVFDVANEINNGNFKPKVGRFCPCDFPQHCPHFSKEIKEVNINKKDNNRKFTKPVKISKDKLTLINELWQLMLKKGYNKKDARSYIILNFNKEKGSELSLKELNIAIKEFKDDELKEAGTKFWLLVEEKKLTGNEIKEFLLKNYGKFDSLKLSIEEVNDAIYKIKKLRIR